MGDSCRVRHVFLAEKFISQMVTGLREIDRQLNRPKSRSSIYYQRPIPCNPPNLARIPLGRHDRSSRTRAHRLRHNLKILSILTRSGDYHNLPSRDCNLLATCSRRTPYPPNSLFPHVSSRSDRISSNWRFRLPTT